MNNEEKIKTIKHKGCIINIYQDLDPQNPDEWGNDDALLVHYHRDFEVKRDGIIKESELAAILTDNYDYYDDGSGYFKNNCQEIQRKYYILPVEAYIHSGIHLSLDGGLVGKLPQGHYRFDVSHVGAILIDKKEYKNKVKAQKRAEGLLSIWNDYLSGNVYGFISEDVETGETIDSCWGFYGCLENSGIINEAKKSIDYYVKKEMNMARTRHYEKVIKDAKEKIKTAKEKLQIK